MGDSNLGQLEIFYSRYVSLGRSANSACFYLHLYSVLHASILYICVATRVVDPSPGKRRLVNKPSPLAPSGVKNQTPEKDNEPLKSDHLGSSNRVWMELGRWNPHPALNSLTSA